MATQGRFLALDVFRGMTICFMIIVNSPGTWAFVYDPLEHAAWHGFTPTDLVFPSFLFAVGNAMAFVMHRYEAQGSRVFWRKTLRRTFVIFLLGFLMYWFPFVDFSDWTLEPLSEARILGVLQRIALCYLFASVIVHFFSQQASLWISAAMLVGYWIIMYAFGDPNDPYSMIGSAATKLDLAVLGENHMYHGEGVAFEPEGILSTLPSIVNVILGYLAGMFIRRYGNSHETVARLMVAGALLTFLALTWDMAFPINKKLWTSSFVLLTVGLDLMIIATLIYAMEIMKYRRGAYFFEVFGKNPLFIYLTSEVFLILMLMIPLGDTTVWGWLYQNVFSSFAGPTLASFLMAFWWMMMNWLFGYFMDKRGIYIKV